MISRVTMECYVIACDGADCNASTMPHVLWANAVSEADRLGWSRDHPHVFSAHWTCPNCPVKTAPELGDAD